MPNWASSGLPNEPHFTALGEGAVRDDVTGLVWQTTTPLMGGTWEVAGAACPPDFRLPSPIELVSLAGPQGGPLDPLVRAVSGSLWTRMPVAGDPSVGWMVLMHEGSLYPWVRTTTYRAVCVRGGKRSAQPHYERTTVGAIAAVRDNWTGLTWQEGHSESRMMFADVSAYCESLGSSFRAPSIKELNTLVDNRRTAPVIDLEYFPNTPSERFWSGTSRGSSVAYLAGFDRGYSNSFSVDEEHYTRCVR